MKIINRSNQKVIADNIKIADSPLKRLTGLLNRTGLEEGEALLVIPCNCIHSFGMRFDFDAIFLDKNNKVVHLTKEMKPCKISPFVFSACSTLELPPGVIDKAGIKINDILEFL